MNRLHLILIALFGFASAFAAETLPRPQHNFLFIVDSSSSMERRKPAAIKMVKDVIASRFDGQIEAGDSIDIWTYDTENNLRGFPPQIWTSTNATRIIESATNYLKQYQFKGRSEFANVATDLNLLVPQTKSLLIVIITDGEQPFAGINLDLEINGYLAQKGKIGTQSKDPLLVSLAAINGVIRTWTAYFGEGNLALASLPGRKAKIAAAPQPPVKEKAKPIAKPKYQEPVVKLDASPSESFSTFNFPPGTRFNPADESAVAAAEQKPLTLAQEIQRYQSRQAEKSRATNPSPLNSASQTNQKTAVAISPTATNLLVAAHTTNLVKTNSQAAAVVQSNQVKTLTNSALASAAINTNKGTNIIAGSAAPTRPPIVNAQVNTPTTTSKTVAASAIPSHAVTSHGTLRNAVYISAVTGVSCVLLGIYLLYRKLRRPTQSIISRSLLQR